MGWRKFHHFLGKHGEILASSNQGWRVFRQDLCEDGEDFGSLLSEVAKSSSGQVDFGRSWVCVIYRWLKSRQVLSRGGGNAASLRSRVAKSSPLHIQIGRFKEVIIQYNTFCVIYWVEVTIFRSG